MATRKNPQPAVLKVEYRPVDSLVPYARNPRRHGKNQIVQIAASIKQFGWTNPILVDGDNGVVGGHGRLAAAQSLRMVEVPVIELAHLTPSQKRAYIIADNKIAEESTWDAGLLGEELKGLEFDGLDLAVLGFGAAELNRLLSPRTDEDDVVKPPADPVTRSGDLWRLGNHRLLCGDATVATDVERLLAGAVPALMVTDPPYGVNYDPTWRNRVDRANGKPYGARAVGLVTHDDRTNWRQAWTLFPGDVVYSWSGLGAKSIESFEALKAAGFNVRMQIIWAKSSFPIGRGDYHVQHEPCWYAVRAGKSSHWCGDRKQTTLWSIDKPVKSETGHSAQKPVECMRRPILNNSKKGDSIYDPFVGSGTTIVAAELTGRRCLSIEISPQYCDVAVARWQTLTGKVATLDHNG